jgi:hypothetical protein
LSRGAVPSHAEAQRRRDLLERLAFRIDREAPCDDGGDQHQAGADRIADEHVRPTAGLDQRAEQRRRGKAAGTGPDRVEDRDGDRAHLERKHLARRQVRRTAPRPTR